MGLEFFQTAKDTGPAGEYTVKTSRQLQVEPRASRMLIADKKSLFEVFRVSHRVWDHQWILFTHLATEVRSGKTIKEYMIWRS
jgi:hypothetical protein